MDNINKEEQGGGCFNWLVFPLIIILIGVFLASFQYILIGLFGIGVVTYILVKVLDW